MASKKPTPIAPSLDAFSDRVAQFYDEIGQPDPKFADLVRAYVTDKRIVDVLSARRKMIMDEIKPYAERGATVLYGDRLLKRSKPTAVVTKRAVSSAQVSKAHPRLWEAAKVPTSYVSFSLSERDQRMAVARADMAVGTADPALRPGMRLDDLAALYMAVPKSKPTRQRLDNVLSTINGVAAMAAWDGLLVTFDDGASLQLKRLQYSSDQLKIIAPELWESLAVESTTGGVQRWYFGNAHGDDYDDDAE